MPCVSLCSSEKDFTWKSAKRSLMNVGRDEQNLAQAVVDGTPSCETVPGPRKAYTQKMRPLSIMLPPDEEVSPPNTPRMQANTKQPIPGPKVRTRASDQSKAKCVERRRVKQLMSVVDTTEGRSFSCNICRKVFSTAARAKKHVAAHLGVRPFKCPVCWKSFNRAQNLEDHMQYHTRGLQLANGGKQNFSSSRSSDRNIEHSVPPRQTLYSCGVCHKQFPTYKDLEVHSIQHNQDNRTLQCKFCNDKFETETLLKEHLKWHEEKQHFHQCARCHLSFYHKEGLNLHILKDHGSALYDVLTAPRRDASTKHHGNRSPDEVKIVSVSEAQTPQNKAIFQRGSQAEKPTLSLQLAQKANNIQATRRLVPAEITAAEALANAWSASSVSSERTSLPEAIRMVCNQCKKPVLSPPVSPTCQSLQLHCNCSSTFQPEQLSPAEMHPQPSTIIPSSSLPLSAVPRPVPSQYQGQLSSNARSSSTLQASRRRPGSTSHRGRPPSSPTHPLLQYPMAATSTSTADPEPEVPKVRRHYKCKICSSTFYKLSEFEKHKTEHDDGRTFMCNSCDENFSTQSEFIRHSKEKHPGPRPYVCDLCPATFRQSTHFKNHRIRHTGEKPYSCPVCGSRFPRKAHLQEHQYLHTGQKLTCDQCGQQFAQPAGLRGHMKRAHTEQNKQGHKCPHCPSSFHTKYCRNLHVHDTHQDKHVALGRSDTTALSEQSSNITIQPPLLRHLKQTVAIPVSMIGDKFVAFKKDKVLMESPIVLWRA